MIKRIGIMAGLLVLGVLVGAGSAFAVVRLFPEQFKIGSARHGPTEFVTVDPLLVPLVFRDGKLAGYITIQCDLEVAKGKGEEAKSRMVLFMNADDMRTFAKPLAAGPDGQLPDLKSLQKLLQEAADVAYGKGYVRRAMVSRANPS